VRFSKEIKKRDHHNGINGERHEEEKDSVYGTKKSKVKLDQDDSIKDHIHERSNSNNDRNSVLPDSSRNKSLNKSDHKINKQRRGLNDYTFDQKRVSNESEDDVIREKLLQVKDKSKATHSHPK